MGYADVADNVSAIVVELHVTVSSNANVNGTDDVARASVTITVLKTLIMVSIMVAAVFGNSLVIVSVFRFEKLRIIANSFIVSLAFADLLVAVLVMPFNASQEIAGKWVFGRIMCDIFNANDVLFSTASLLHLCCISMDRYIAIMDPFHYETKMTRTRVCVMLCCVWGASGLISHIPIHLGWYTTPEQRNALEKYSESCTFIVNKVYAAISSSISFWTPTFIMVFTYVKIYREARRQEKQIRRLTKISGSSFEHLNKITSNGTGGASQNENGTSLHVPTNPRLSQDRKKMKREHKAAKTLGIIMGAFLLCWLPFFLWYVASSMCDRCHTPDVVVGILFWIGYCNSALNPVIYAFFNRDFRNAFMRLLRCPNVRSSCFRRGPEGDALAGYATEMHNRPCRPDILDSSTPSPQRCRRYYDTVD